MEAKKWTEQGKKTKMPVEDRRESHIKRTEDISSIKQNNTLKIPCRAE